MVRWAIPLLGASLLLAGCGGQAGPAPSSAAAPVSPSVSLAASKPAPSAAAEAKPSAAGSPSAAAPAKPSPSAAASGLAPVRFGANGTSVDSTIYFLTQSAGIFQKNGLNVNIQPANGQASLDAVVSGQSDGLSIGGPQTVLLSIQQGAPMKIVAIPNTKYNVIIVTPNSITSLDQLKGKRVGAQSLTSINATGLRRALHDVGLEAGKDYQFVGTGQSASANGVVAALLAHQIDAAPLDDVSAQAALSQGGFHALLDLADPKANISAAFSVVAFRPDFIQQKPDAMQKMVDSLVQGIRYFKENKDAAEAVIKTRSKIDDHAQLDEVYNRQVQLLTKDVTPSTALLMDAATFVPEGAKPIPDSQVAASIDPRFGQDAAKRGLTNY